MANENIPVMLKRVTVAIMKKRHTFSEAFNIARASLTQQGYLKKGSEEGPVANIKMTMKGEKRNREHLRKGTREVMVFDKQFRRHAAKVGGLFGPEPEREDQM